METIKVPVGKIISSTDRKYGGEGNIDTLAQSIKEHGLIHPLAVKESKEKPGHYRVIAGRRRFEAIKLLGWKKVDVIVHDQKVNEESIALAENVNREDMHPLDEAETFKRQLESGKGVEEIAKYYSRSTAGIYQRIRLTNLDNEIKAMFRDGKINLAAAALISSLPHADQAKFFKKYGEKTAVDKWEVCNFMRSVQKQTIKYIADKKCENCKERTHNTTPGLFEDDYSSLEDICFNSECYSKKWCALISSLIAKQTGETENNIILNRLPEFLPKKSKTITIGDQEYTLIPSNGHDWKETIKKGKAKTAWLVSLNWAISSSSYSVKVTRVTYEKQERQTYSDSGYQSQHADPVKIFMIDQIPGISEEDKKVVVEKVKAAYNDNPWSFRNEVKECMLDSIITDRLKKGGENYDPANFYLVTKISGEDEEGNWQEIAPDYQQYFTTAFGEGVSATDIKVDAAAEKLFLFLIAISLRPSDMPDLSDSDVQWARAEQTAFWQFAQMTREEYIEMYKTILDVKVSEVLSAGQKEEPAGLPDDIDENRLTEELGDE
jgi:ParB/RepB/Spo0J family partition protein